MPQVSAQEFELLPLRVHTFLAGVPLHDVWAVDLPWTRPGVTLDELLQARCACPSTLSPVARALLSIRFSIGRLLGWDGEPTSPEWETFATRLTTAPIYMALIDPFASCSSIPHSYAAFALAGIRHLADRDVKLDQHSMRARTDSHMKCWKTELSGWKFPTHKMCYLA